MSFPFAGIVTERPYPPTGLTSARWLNEVRIEPVEFAELYLTQNGVRISPLFGVEPHESSDLFPHVVQWNGKRYLENGHHRVTRAALVYNFVAMLMRVFPIGETP